MNLLIYQPLQASKQEFVSFWGQQYSYDKESLYTDNIGHELTGPCILELYRWKNGMRLSERKRESIRRNFIERSKELEELKPDISPKEFLTKFCNGGAIWRIFWLHYWQPSQFPIYDQHVHRAMAFIEKGTPEEIPDSDQLKIESYINRYLPFHAQFNDMDGRNVDKAIWAFGKFIKEVNYRVVIPSRIKFE